MRHVKAIGLIFVLLLIGCTTAQDEGNSAETPASQPGTAQPETTDSQSEASTASVLDMGVAAVEIATGEKRWVDDYQPSTLDAIPRTSPNDVYEIQQTDRVVLKTESGVTGLNLSGEQAFVGWLPDSSAFVVLSNATGPEDWQTYELYLVSAENPAQIDLLTAHSNIAYADIAPNGQAIAFTSNANSDHIDAYQLYTLDLATKAVTQLTEREAAFPRWSPSGEWIAFSSYEARRDLFMVRPDGSNLTRLTTSLADEWGVRWSDDGASVLFLSEKTPDAPSYQTEESYRAENTLTKLTLRDHQQQVVDLLTGAPFSFSVGAGNANNRVELMVPTEQAWQLFIADANFELPESVVVLFAYEAGFDAPPANLNTPDDIYLARRQFPPTIVEGVGFSYMRVVVEDGCVLLRNEWTEQLHTLIVPPHLFLHADGDALVLRTSSGDVVAVIGQTPVGGGSELNWDRLPPLQTPIPDHCRVGNPIYTTEFLLGEAITLPDDSEHYAADLINRRWLWRQTVLADSTEAPATADLTPWLKFTSKPAAAKVGGETLEGNMGCNSFSGGFLANIEGFMQIRIDTQTASACQAEQTDSETLWLSLVPRIISFKIEAGLLYLQTDEGDSLVFADGGS